MDGILSNIIFQLEFMFSSLSFVDLLDLLVVSAIVFIVLQALQETRALHVVRGILIAVILGGILTSVLAFSTLNWLYRNILPAIFLTLPILFQDELRRVFANLGRLSRRRGYGSEFDRFKETIKTTVERLSYEYIGAVIVLEGQTPLYEIIDTGVPLNAEVITPELLSSIFNPKSSLHDGAVILREERLVAANCILPVQADSVGPSHLDSRQRSALGMSAYAPDALVIVLSEESSDFSVVEDGHLREGLSLEQLEEVLVVFQKKNFDRGWHRWAWIRKGGLSAVARNLFLALSLALIFWVLQINAADPIEERGVEIPLELIGVSPELYVTSDLPASVSVVLQIRRSQFDSFDSTRYRAWMDLTGLQPGVHEVPIQVSPAIELFRIVDMSPDIYNVSLEPLTSSKLKPSVTILDLKNLPLGYSLGELSTDPDVVSVAGPQSMVDQVAEARIEVELNDHRADFQEKYTPVLLDYSGQIVNGLTISPDQLRVIVPIQRVLFTRDMAIFASVAQETVEPGYKITRIRVSPVAVTVLGERSALENAGDYLLTAPVRLTNVVSELTVDIPLILPEGVTIYDDQGEGLTSVTVVVTVSPLNY